MLKIEKLDLSQKHIFIYFILLAINHPYYTIFLNKINIRKVLQTTNNQYFVKLLLVADIENFDKAAFVYIIF